MKSTVDSTRSHGFAASTPLAQHFGGALSQAITLLRIGAVLLILYLKFKILLWIGHRRGGSE